MTDTTRISPQEADPLSWFTGPRLPLVLAVAAAGQGVGITIFFWQKWANPVVVLAAIPIFVLAGWVVTWTTRPHRPQFGPRQAFLALGVASIALVVGAIGTGPGGVPVAQWWPAISAGATIASLSPYSSVRRLLLYSVPFIAEVMVIAAIVFAPYQRFWTPIGTVIIIASPVIVGAVGSIVFAGTIVRQALRHLEAGVAEEAEAGHPAAPVLRGLAERPEAFRGRTGGDAGSVARLSARVAPFLEQVARSGRITDADRGFAAQLARHLRTELVDAANRSWLDDIAHETGITVSDPLRLADKLGEPQRAALRGLLLGALESPTVSSESLLVELRAAPRGVTAVALSIDVDLPEGPRLLLLAPYYLTLKTTVDNLRWDDGRRLTLEFQVPPQDH
ncbi:hypothetical protein [Galbitalea soli]|uniref:Uncharacterized protein n=1 Tax=Galbitalea soli TaxID=1268042 RepID=A0A7C9TQI1_9MICO|nr:hypothetical protein [Galbitalea soli]NEM90644.1 hypothetical protein [Galbitalea soli]NYJ31362.1 hypothetical protein [Galbitalea soli]